MTFDQPVHVMARSNAERRLHVPTVTVSPTAIPPGNSSSQPLVAALLDSPLLDRGDASHRSADGDRPTDAGLGLGCD
ncbi:MAG TPA: hypothetical protein VJ301_11860 [Propionibacteriaceae bacterium]|nr:hypothetical protein [Propionibacteriaceae bacterium]